MITGIFLIFVANNNEISKYMDQNNKPKFIRVPYEANGREFTAHVNVNKIIYATNRRIYFQAGKYVPTTLSAFQIGKILEAL